MTFTIVVKRIQERKITFSIEICTCNYLVYLSRVSWDVYSIKESSRKDDWFQFTKIFDNRHISNENTLKLMELLRLKGKWCRIISGFWGLNDKIDKRAKFKEYNWFKRIFSIEGGILAIKYQWLHWGTNISFSVAFVFGTNLNILMQLCAWCIFLVDLTLILMTNNRRSLGELNRFLFKPYKMVTNTEILIALRPYLFV